MQHINDARLDWRFGALENTHADVFGLRYSRSYSQISLPSKNWPFACYPVDFTLHIFFGIHILTDTATERKMTVKGTAGNTTVAESFVERQGMSTWPFNMPLCWSTALLMHSQVKYVSALIVFLGNGCHKGLDIFGGLVLNSPVESLIYHYSHATTQPEKRGMFIPYAP